MKPGILLMCLMIPSAEAFTEQVLDSASWQQMQREGRLLAGIVDESGALVIENPESTAQTFPLATFTAPAITSSAFGIVGEVSYEGVAAKSYLELLAHFNHGQFFTRTLADAGPLRSLQGSSDWRPFSLPFVVSDSSAGKPRQVDLQLVLGGKGIVRLRSVRLVDLDSKTVASALHTAAGWWSDPAGGLLGGALGGLIGCIGALIGLLASLGRGRSVVVGALGLLTAIGLAGLVTGIVALATRQPYAVFYPCLLIGVLGTALPLSMARSILRRFDDIEFRRMRALDLS